MAEQKSTAAAENDFLKQLLTVLPEAVPRISAALKQFPADETLATQSGNAIFLLAKDSDTYRKQFAAKGAISAVVAAMKAHPDKPVVQEALAQAVIGLTTNSGANAVEIVGKGGLDSLLATLKVHGTGKSSLAPALLQAINLLLTDNPSHSKLAAKAVAHESVIASMKANNNVVRVQEQGSGVLRALVADAGEKAVIKAAGGVELLKQAMAEHPNSGLLEENATEALGLMRDK